MSGTEDTKQTGDASSQGWQWERPGACLPSGITETLWVTTLNLLQHKKITASLSWRRPGMQTRYARRKAALDPVEDELSCGCLPQQGHECGRDVGVHHAGLGQAGNCHRCLQLRSRGTSSNGDWPDFHQVQSHRPPSTMCECMWNMKDIKACFQ